MVQGRVPNWYKNLEKDLLKDPLSRKLKAPLETENLLHIKADLEKISEDRRKQEWLVFRNMTAKPEIGRIAKKKTSHEFLIEHWTQDLVNEQGLTIVKKCEGCVLAKEETVDLSSCQTRKKMRGVKRALNRNWVENCNAPSSKYRRISVPWENILEKHPETVKAEERSMIKIPIYTLTKEMLLANVVGQEVIE